VPQKKTTNCQEHLGGAAPPRLGFGLDGFGRGAEPSWRKNYILHVKGQTMCPQGSGVGGGRRIVAWGCHLIFFHMPQIDRTTIGGRRWTPPKDTKDAHRCATTINENLFNLRISPCHAPPRYLWSYSEFFKIINEIFILSSHCSFPAHY